MKLLLVSLLAVAAVNAFAAGDPPARAFDFTHDVLPILQRQGCSSAYCHGSATGRAGFKLSLFGSDPAADYDAIAAQFGGRRIDRRDPDSSLLVQKALGRLDHGGERRIARDGVAHRALLDWIAAGAPWRSGPQQTLLWIEAAHDAGRLRVTAGFVSGAQRVRPIAASVASLPFSSVTSSVALETRDVTALASFGTTDPSVVDVDADGVLTERGPGQAFVTARYGNCTDLVRFVRPFVAAAPVPTTVLHPLDKTWYEHLAELGLGPAPPVDAAQLARRLHLDLIGRPPTPHELDEFVAKPDAYATAAALAARPEFAQVWGEHLARWFEVPAGDERARAAFVASLARGDTLLTIAERVANGDLGTLDRQPDPRDRAEYFGRTLLGVRIGCARCHDHPLDHWRRSEHLAFSACFASARPDGAGGMAAGVLFDPDSGEVVAPKLLDLQALEAEALVGDRREALRTFVLGRASGQLADNLANRLFAELVGRGLVEPRDDHRDGNPALSFGMLGALGNEFRANGGRLQDLVRFVAWSAVYAASCAGADGPATHYLAARSSLPLAPESYARAVEAVVGHTGVGALPGTPLARELALRNGEALPAALAAGGTTIDAIFDTGGQGRERLHELWRTVLSRAPRADEEERFLPLASQDLSAFRDLAYALLTGREFGHRR